ncbi:hypothetical protein [Hydromonas duriensis]|uniref:Signal peptide prediction n=1 Tax=Hydromonas duriensis TaxID=1527608 RepID=A0A4R6YBJ4_9BURK|nr:hypothetical protein [Hydromonas duriensis]TDR33026.1 hypothetical protein DFR44_10176 [Hydromonas duriensis]
MLKVVKFLWALPVTMVGLLVLLLAAPSRPRVGWLRMGSTGALCAWGGWLDVWLQRHPLGAMYAATLGHVVIARDMKKLCYCAAHEFEHVRQTERWGVFLPFLYVINGLWQVLHKRRFYRDNWFERAAYRYDWQRFSERGCQKYRKHQHNC